MKRSVERVGGIKRIDFDMNLGRGTLLFDPGKKVAPEAIWDAIKKGGFTPVEVEIGGQSYKGPK